jgi:hypothetical protein
MCWFVKGVVEKSKRDDTDDAASQASVRSPDVDAHVPDDTYPVARGVIADFGVNCKANH